MNPATSTPTDPNPAVDRDPRLKPRRTRSRELASPSATPVHEGGGMPRSPTQRNPGGKTSRDDRRQRSSEDSSFARGGLWPSAMGISAPSPSNSKKVGTLADHLGNERLRDFLDRKGDRSGDSPALAAIGRQRSTSEICRFENDDQDKDAKKSAKENHRPILGGSMRYTGKLLFPGRKSSSSSNGNVASPPPVIPPRYSVDESALYKKSSRKNSEPPPDSESECSDVSSSTSNLSSTGMGKKPAGIDVASRYMNNVIGRRRRELTDPSARLSFDEGTRSSRFVLKGAIKRAGSLTGYGSAMSQWALSPGRSGSSPMSVENKEKPQSFSSLKPPSSPSRPKGVEKLLNLGLDLFKSKKSTSYTPPAVSANTASAENVHRIRMMHNRLVQWQYANARADATNARITNQAEINLASAVVGLTKLQHTVLQKKLQLEKERAEMKLFAILSSQIRPLEKWGDLERQHTLAICKTSECLQSIVLRVPLIDGTRFEPKTTSSALRRAYDVTTVVKANLINLSLVAEKTVPLLSELARVVTQEKLIMEECLDYLRTLSELEVQETSLMCNAVQLKQKRPQELETVC
ncbi:hypothetical protein MLD38_003077 [Melastoma candidum]|uniref:Uncharacterized protein n=1 Tax=Melastoma candidum TaxID=119954 RepID=A0ACB9S1G3_9MYRT|nr:hypothetical protein MLD38_003077 [Melastoma candidum]